MAAKYCLMENHKYCMLLVFVAVCIALEATLVHTQDDDDDQSGFISIDCGLIPEGSNYTDPTTGIFYISDAGFIDTGVSKTISHKYLNNFVAQHYATVRSFPQGTRNCYTIRTAQVKGHKYLIRASFRYANYDGKDQPPIFDLYLGADFWETVNLTDPSTSKHSEIVHNPLSDYIYVCLVKTGAYTPFISAIELRLLEDTMYSTPDKSLSLFARADFGPLGYLDRHIPIRYKDDIYDRLWLPFGFRGTTTLSSNSTLDTSNATLTRPPPKIMSTAVEAPNNSPKLTFSSQPLNMITRDKIHIFMHFAELEPLRGEQFREFNIYLNGRLWYGPLAPEYLKAKIIHHQIPDQGLDQVLRFEINKTKSSTLPPLINALEIYREIEFPGSRTEDMNVAAMLDIKSTYKLKRNWQGDPCTPQTFLWDGLNCSYDGLDPATIISLNLSSFGLNGKIAPSISNLTSLQMLDLSNNNLIGQVPQFLAELASLKVLMLKGNFFNGTIPERLLEKSNDGTLLLSIDDPMKSTDEKPNGTGKNMVVIPIIASVAATLLIVLTVDL